MDRNDRSVNGKGTRKGDRFPATSLTTFFHTSSGGNVGRGVEKGPNLYGIKEMEREK